VCATYFDNCLITYSVHTPMNTVQLCIAPYSLSNTMHDKVSDVIPHHTIHTRVQTGYSSNESRPNNVCCGPDQECVEIAAKYGSFTACILKGRPKTCDECKNGSSCFDSNYYSYAEDAPQYLSCICDTLKWTGIFCEIPK
jgi:hypothetical protein